MHSIWIVLFQGKVLGKQASVNIEKHRKIEAGYFNCYLPVSPLVSLVKVLVLILETCISTQLQVKPLLTPLNNQTTEQTFQQPQLQAPGCEVQDSAKTN